MAVLNIPFIPETSSEATREIERQINHAWNVFQRVRHSPSSLAKLRRPVARIARQVRELDVAFDDWVVVNRQVLRLEQVILQERVSSSPDAPWEAVTAVNVDMIGKTRIPDPLELPTRESIDVVITAPARRAARAMMEAPIALSTRLVVVALTAIVGADLLSMIVALMVTDSAPGWATAIIVGAPLLGMGFAVLVVCHRPARALLDHVRQRARAALHRHLPVQTSPSP